MRKIETVAALKDLIDLYRAAGWLDDLFSKGHVATGRIAALIEVPKASLKYAPEYSPLIRSLARERLLAVPPSIEDVGSVHRFVEDVHATGAESRTELARSCSTLYKKVLKHPNKEEIFRLCGLVSQREGLALLTDHQIIGRCGDYSSLTEMKYRNLPLHWEVKGRELERKVTLAHGWCNFNYAGLFGLRYRSRMELVIGNLLVANGVSFDYDGALPGNRPEGSKPLRYDFRLKALDSDLYIEVLQNDERWNKRGARDRKAMYAKGLPEKRRHYVDNGLSVVWLNSEHYSTHDGAMGLAQLCVAELAEHGVGLVMPPKEQLFFSPGSDLHRKSADQILNDELSECRGVADFENHYSTLRNELKHRPDYPEIKNELRERGRQARRAAAAPEESRASCAMNLPRPRPAWMRCWSWGRLRARRRLLSAPNLARRCRRMLSATVTGTWLPAFLRHKKQLHPALDGRLSPVTTFAYTRGRRESVVRHPAVVAAGGDGEAFANLFLGHELHGDSVLVWSLG